MTDSSDGEIIVNTYRLKQNQFNQLCYGSDSASLKSGSVKSTHTILSLVKKPIVRVSASLIVLSSSMSNAFAEDNGVIFPQDYKLGKHYATVNRGDIREELYTSIDAILAAKNNQPFPDGTVIMMEDYRDDQL